MSATGGREGTSGDTPALALSWLTELRKPHVLYPLSIVSLQRHTANAYHTQEL